MAPNPSTPSKVESLHLTMSGTSLTWKSTLLVKTNCRRRRAERAVFKPTTQPLELIYSDTSGKLPKTIGGNQYFILFINDYTHWGRVYFLSDKTIKTILNAFMHYKNEVESH